ncbi:hypothetical protein BH11PSE4_BH11PSE4_05540 [soil metagenome]
MRFVAFVMLCGVLGGCARDPYVTAEGETTAGNWYIAHQIDRVTGAELPSAITFALASNTYAEYPRASQIQLTCVDRKPLVRFAFDFRIGTDRDSVLGYRFDDKPGHENVEARILRGQKILIMESDSELARFINELPGSSKVYVRVRSMTLGRTAVEYDLDGSAAAIQAAYAKCPMPALSGARSSQAPIY